MRLLFGLSLGFLGIWAVSAGILRDGTHAPAQVEGHAGVGGGGGHLREKLGAQKAKQAHTLKERQKEKHIESVMTDKNYDNNQEGTKRHKLFGKQQVDDQQGEKHGVLGQNRKKREAGGAQHGKVSAKTTTSVPQKNAPSPLLNNAFQPTHEQEPLTSGAGLKKLMDEAMKAFPGGGGGTAGSGSGDAARKRRLSEALSRSTRRLQDAVDAMVRARVRDVVDGVPSVPLERSISGIVDREVPLALAAVTSPESVLEENNLTGQGILSNWGVNNAQGGGLFGSRSQNSITIRNSLSFEITQVLMPGNLLNLQQLQLCLANIKAAMIDVKLRMMELQTVLDNILYMANFKVQAALAKLQALLAPLNQGLVIPSVGHSIEVTTYVSVTTKFAGGQRLQLGQTLSEMVECLGQVNSQPLLQVTWQKLYNSIEMLMGTCEVLIRQFQLTAQQLLSLTQTRQNCLNSLNLLQVPAQLTQNNNVAALQNNLMGIANNLNSFQNVILYPKDVIVVNQAAGSTAPAVTVNNFNVFPGRGGVSGNQGVRFPLTPIDLDLSTSVNSALASSNAASAAAAAAAAAGQRQDAAVNAALAAAAAAAAAASAIPEDNQNVRSPVSRGAGSIGSTATGQNPGLTTGGLWGAPGFIVASGGLVAVNPSANMGGINRANSGISSAGTGGSGNVGSTSGGSTGGGINTGVNTQGAVNRGVNTGFNSGVNFGVNTGINTGVNTGINTGTGSSGSTAGSSTNQQTNTGGIGNRLSSVGSLGTSGLPIEQDTNSGWTLDFNPNNFVFASNAQSMGSTSGGVGSSNMGSTTGGNRGGLLGSPIFNVNCNTERSSLLCGGLNLQLPQIDSSVFSGLLGIPSSLPSFLPGISLPLPTLGLDSGSLRSALFGRLDRMQECKDDADAILQAVERVKQAVAQSRGLFQNPTTANAGTTSASGNFAAGSVSSVAGGGVTGNVVTGGNVISAGNLVTGGGNFFVGGNNVITGGPSLVSGGSTTAGNQQTTASTSQSQSSNWPLVWLEMSATTSAAATACMNFFDAVNGIGAWNLLNSQLSGLEWTDDEEKADKEDEFVDVEEAKERRLQEEAVPGMPGLNDAVEFFHAIDASVSEAAVDEADEAVKILKELQGMNAVQSSDLYKKALADALKSATEMQRATKALKDVIADKDEDLDKVGELAKELDTLGDGKSCDVASTRAP